MTEVESWFTTGEAPVLRGRRCTVCGATVFPPVRDECPDPRCPGTSMGEVSLSRRGTVWSFTTANYRPPAPYVPPAGGHTPFGLVAVSLPEGLVVLGQLADAFDVRELTVGADVELVVELMHGEAPGGALVWKWRPVTVMPTGRGAA